MTTIVRKANVQDLDTCLSLRLKTLGKLCEDLSADETWCPVEVPIPWLPDEKTTTQHFAAGANDRWAVVLERENSVEGCLLLQTIQEKREITIRGHQEWLSSTCDGKEGIAELLTFVVTQGRSAGMEKVTVHFHGPARQVLPLADLYRSLGFGGGTRLEMVTRDLEVDPGRRDIEFRTAGEIGENAFHENEVAVGRFKSLEESKEDCAISRRIWNVDRATDWIVTYLGSEPVATTRVAVAKNGTGVVDDITVAENHRNQGIGAAVLVQALRTLNGRTDAVWADTDEDNVPAIRLNQKLGFRTQHHHGGLSFDLG